MTTTIHTTASLAVAAADKLAKICGLFSSHHDGERAAAAAKADSIVRSMGLTWSDAMRVPRPAAEPAKPKKPRGPTSSASRDAWQMQAAYCQRRGAPDWMSAE